jgi:hypothetical protein
MQSLFVGQPVGRFSFIELLLTHFGQPFQNYRISAKFGATFFHGTSCLYIIFDKKWFCYILGDFFANSDESP